MDIINTLYIYIEKACWIAIGIACITWVYGKIQDKRYWKKHTK